MRYVGAPDGKIDPLVRAALERAAAERARLAAALEERLAAGTVEALFAADDAVVAEAEPEPDPRRAAVLACIERDTAAAAVLRDEAARRRKADRRFQRASGGTPLGWAPPGSVLPPETPVLFRL